jgi:DNA polymerase III subunit alpha
MPKVPAPRADDSEPVLSLELLWEWCREGWRYRLSQGGPSAANMQDRGERKRYLAQLNHEMQIIEQQDYVDYFLLVSDLVRFAKDAGIPVGPGRGSSAASLVCWLIRITEVDPLLYPLTDFSRFVVPGREDLPDIDIDFDDERRHEVRAYAVRRYGAERVGNIGTFTKFKGRSAIDDVARVFRLPVGDMEQLKGMIVERSGGDSRADAALADTFEMFPEAKVILEKHPALAHAMELEGNYRGMSVHAAGLVIANRPISEICALYTRDAPGEAGKRGETLTAVSVNKYDAEYLGLMKVDILGLSTMGMIRIALEFAGMSLEELYRVPMDDEATLAAFARADVTGIFQFEGRATRLVVREVVPESFLELVDINGLSRPGPLFSGTKTEYVEVKHGRRDRVSLHPTIDEITEGTKGTIIYQEQILRALRVFGGLDVKRVHEIRRIISLKLGEAQFNTSADDFVANAVALHGVTEETARAVWGRVVTSASYAFVYAHSLAYAMIGFWCMYLKVHHPAAFYAAQLRKTEEDRWPRLIRDAEAHGIAVRGVTPDRSKLTWEPHGKSEVVAGWLQLKGVGPGKAGSILAAIEGGTPIRESADLLAVKGFGEKTVAKLAEQIDTDDPFGLQLVRRSLDAVRAGIADRSIPLRTPNLRSSKIIDFPPGQQIVWVGMVKLIEYKDYIEDQRSRFGLTLEEIRTTIKRPDLPTYAVLHGYDDEDEDVYVRVPRFDFPRFARAIKRIAIDRDVIWVRARKGVKGFGASIYLADIAVIEPD